MIPQHLYILYLLGISLRCPEVHQNKLVSRCTSTFCAGYTINKYMELEKVLTSPPGSRRVFLHRFPGFRRPMNPWMPRLVWSLPCSPVRAKLPESGVVVPVFVSSALRRTSSKIWRKICASRIVDISKTLRRPRDPYTRPMMLPPEFAPVGIIFTTLPSQNTFSISCTKAARHWAY